ncbi:phage holin family protein [Ruminococcaceae bacterium OttesenSCG-928-I18]|nr:phage holin family protein [Ruminococcaceae bacterium OttesenSCG-928-I18]
MEQFTEFVKPELLVLVPVLMFVGLGFKKWGKFKDNHIPLALGGCGVLLSALYIVGTTDTFYWQDTLMALFTAFTQGILCAGLSVYVNQIWKQETK